MPCSKKEYVEVNNPQDPRIIRDLCDKMTKDELFGFLQVNIHVPDELVKKFSPLFIVDNITEDQIPHHIKDYQEKSGRKTIRGTKKLLGVNKALKILLSTPMLKWYLSPGFKVTAIHKYIKYKSGKPFSWFPKEVSKARHDGDNDPALKQLGDTYKLKGNSFYGKMIGDLMKHQRITFTTNEDLVDQSFRSSSFEDLKEINGAFEIKERKKRLNITRPCQCGIAVYQLAKLRMLEFYYSFLDYCFDRRDFELLQMDTDLCYMVWSAKNINDLVKPELREEYYNGGKEEFCQHRSTMTELLGFFSRLSFRGRE